MTRPPEASDLRRLYEPPLEGWGNDDLLYSAEAQEIAKRDDPDACKVLHWPELNAAFRRFEDPAKTAKNSHRRIGVFAALFAGMGAAGLPLVTQFVPQDDRSWWAFVAIILSLLGVFLGILHFVLHRGGRSWLGNRMVAERLRHFYFHNLLENFAQVAETIADERRLPDWQATRAAALDKVTRVLNDCRENDWDQLSHDRLLQWIWLSPDESMTWEKSRDKVLASLPALGDKADALLARLYSQRLVIQEKYAFKAKQFSISGFASWARLSRWVSNLSLIGVPILITISGELLFSAPADEAPLKANPAMLYLTLAAALSAIGLAAKAFELGLRAQDDFDRNMEYLKATKTLRLKYCREAPTAEDKVKLLFDLEREAYWETREFFVTHRRDSFFG